MTTGEKVCHVLCYCKTLFDNNATTAQTPSCLPCQIDAAIVKEKEPLRQKLLEYENGFWAKVAMKLSYSIKQLQKKLNDNESI